MEAARVIGHVVAVSGFRLKVELSPEAKSSSRATLDGVQRAVAINSFLTFDLGAGTHAIGTLSDLEARESYDPTQDNELSLELTKPRRIASVQLLGTVRQTGHGGWMFDTGITVLPTLDTPAEVANPDILACVFGQPPKRNRPQDWPDGEEFDCALELGYQTGDENTRVWGATVCGFHDGLRNAVFPRSTVGLFCAFWHQSVRRLTSSSNLVRKKQPDRSSGGLARSSAF